jgi:hypothetical protein
MKILECGNVDHRTWERKEQCMFCKAKLLVDMTDLFRIDLGGEFPKYAVYFRCPLCFRKVRIDNTGVPIEPVSLPDEK